MRLVSDYNALYGEIQALKRSSGSLLTNLYASPEKFADWGQHGDLYVEQFPGTIFLLKRDDGFYHLYYHSRNANELARALTDFDAHVQMPLVVDLVGRSDEVRVMKGIFEQGGFQEYALFQRMCSGIEIATFADLTDVDDQDVACAAARDVQYITEMLKHEFDRYCEHIPTSEEIASAVRQRTILLLRYGAKTAGMLFYELTGLSSSLRYWYVDPQYRGQHVGSKLMRYYFRKCRTAKRHLLWVQQQNEIAIMRYCHYGYQPDGLVDQVMMKTVC